QSYIDGHWADRASYAGGCCNNLGLQPDVGSVGIGTLSPSYKLQVNGDIYANGGWVRVGGSYGLYFESYGGGWYMQDTTWIRSAGGKYLYEAAGLDTGGASGINCGGGLGGGYTFRVCGNMAASAFLYSSDARLKDNVKPIDNALWKLLQIKGVS